MSSSSFFIFLSIHLVCVLVYAVFIFLGKSNHQREFIAILLFIPVFGILAALVIDLYYKLEGHNQKPVEISTLSLGENTYWKPIESKSEDTNLIPLEEAISINDTKTRRKLMLESLYDNPSKYIDVLMVARKNDDIETVHYASTTISKIQRDFQLEMQKMSVAIEKNPEDIHLLDTYIEIIQNYINSDILEDYLLRRQRLLFEEILNKRINQGGVDKNVLLLRINNNLALKNFQAAFDDSQVLTELWPDDEQVWIEVLRVCVESNDADRLKKIINELKNLSINWSSKNRKLISTWLEGD
jgi:hypothetical protein